MADVERAPAPLSGGPVLGALDPSAPSPFGPTSILRRVVAEPVLALLTQRILVMDVAHPQVAAGVDDHSRFLTQPWRRAVVTVDAALRLVFGSTETARGAARQIYATHDRIHGTVAEPPEPGATAAAYTAHDAALLTWVWATLVDSAETGYGRFVAPLSESQAEAFYAEMLAFAGFVGIPADCLPPDREAFAAYLEAMLAGGTLGTTTASRTLARHVLFFDHRVVPSPVVRIGRVLALATLDRRLIEALGLEAEAADERFGRRLDTLLRTVYPHLPRARTGVPRLYVALRRPTIGLATAPRRLAGTVGGWVPGAAPPRRPG